MVQLWSLKTKFLPKGLWKFHQLVEIQLVVPKKAH